VFSFLFLFLFLFILFIRQGRGCVTLLYNTYERRAREERRKEQVVRGRRGRGCAFCKKKDGIGQEPLAANGSTVPDAHREPATNKREKPLSASRLVEKEI
jgi:hypothetical protein